MNRKEKILIIICSILSIMIMFNIFIIEVSIVKVIKDYNLKEEKLEVETSRDFCSRDLFTDQLTYLVNEQLVYANLDGKNIYNDIVNKDSENTFKKHFESKGWEYSISLDRDGVNRGYIKLNKDGRYIKIVGQRENLESTMFKEYFKIKYIIVSKEGVNYFDPNNDRETLWIEDYDEIDKMLSDNYKINEKEEFTKAIEELLFNFLSDYKIFLNNKC